MSVTSVAPWQRPEPDLTDYRPVTAYPAPKPADPGAGRIPASNAPAVPAPSRMVAWAPAAAPARPVPAPPPPGTWHPKSPGPARARSAHLPAGPGKVTWCRPVPACPGTGPASRGRPQVTISTPPEAAGEGCDINYDPPPEAAGTGLQCTNPDGSWVVHPLSVIHPGSTIGDEGPINEAFLSTPVVYLAAGRPYALASPVVIPDGATLYVNRAAIDRAMFLIGDGATVYD